MPIFRTTHGIFKEPWKDELFDINLMDYDTLKLLPKKNWDYKREMKVEDVDIWEEIYLQGGGTGLYAAWMPYAEFYMILKNIYWSNDGLDVETFYGPGAGQKAYTRARELGMPIFLNDMWVEEEDMWLYTQQENKKIIIP